ncbi:MAG: hydrolase 2, exosortase A system-associated, partial [Pseudomonadota bacterium]
NLWGCRLGALLALDFAGSVVYHINNILLWQPILNGQSFLTQFLRLELASKIFSPDSQEINSVSLLRNTLANGKVLEIAGYELSPELTGAIDRLKINDFNPTNHAIHWIEVVADINQPISSAKINIMGKWKKGGNTVEITQVSCLPFWVTQEISECQNLISITTDLFTDQSEHVD